MLRLAAGSARTMWSTLMWPPSAGVLIDDLALATGTFPGDLLGDGWDRSEWVQLADCGEHVWAGLNSELFLEGVLEAVESAESIAGISATRVDFYDQSVGAFRPGLGLDG